MNWEIFAGVGLLLSIALLGAILVPQVARWYADSLRKHANGMEAFWDGMGDACRAYRRNRREVMSLEDMEKTSKKLASIARKTFEDQARETLDESEVAFDLKDLTFDLACPPPRTMLICATGDCGMCPLCLQQKV